MKIYFYGKNLFSYLATPYPALPQEETFLLSELFPKFPEEYLEKYVCCWYLVSYQVFVWRSGHITKGTGDGGGEACTQRRITKKSKRRD